MLRQCGLFSVLLVLVAVCTTAAPVTWTLDGVFLDGGTLSGSFDFDADTSVYSNIAVTSTPGSSSAAGEFYTAVRSDSNSSLLVLLPGVLPDYAGSYIAGWLFNPPLTNAGGTTALNFAVEGTCDNATCTSISPIRGLQGTATTDAPPPSSVPEPAAVILLGGGLAALFLWRRMRSLRGGAEPRLRRQEAEIEAEQKELQWARR